MKYYILYNPLAGKGKGAEAEDAVKKAFPEAEVSCVDLTQIADLSDFHAKTETDSVLVIAGGDGTLNRFINALSEEELLTHEILYCATGSGNDFLHDVAEGADAPISIRSYLTSLPTVTVQGKSYRFLNGVGYGIDGYCCEVGDKKRSSGAKAINYTGIAIRGLLFFFSPRRATVTVDGVTKTYRKVWIAPTMKGRCYGGGMIPTPTQDRNSTDGKLSTMIFHGTGKLRTLMIFPSIFKGEHVRHTKVVEVLQGKEIHVAFDRPCALQIDGETITGVSEYTVSAGVPSAQTNAAVAASLA